MESLLLFHSAPELVFLHHLAATIYILASNGKRQVWHVKYLAPYQHGVRLVYGEASQCFPFDTKSIPRHV